MKQIRHNKLRAIVISNDNYDRLKKLGNAGESFNDVLTQILLKKSEDVKAKESVTGGIRND